MWLCFFFGGFKFDFAFFYDDSLKMKQVLESLKPEQILTLNLLLTDVFLETRVDAGERDSGVS